MRLLIFGLGYVGRAMAAQARLAGWTVAATGRSPSAELGVEAVALEAAAAAAMRADAVLITARPDDDGCPGLRALEPGLGGQKWVGYLSSTAVYGDYGGGWVFEDSPLRPKSAEGVRRAAAEQAWLGAGRSRRLSIAVMRLPGIYGPGRSPLDRLRSGQARSLVREGQVFSRIHVDDLVAGLQASIARPRAGGVYNLCDDEPAPAHIVTAHGATLLGLPAPRLDPYLEETAPPEARRFYAESKRVSNALAKAELGWRPRYPTYREGLAAILAAEA